MTEENTAAAAIAQGEYDGTFQVRVTTDNLLPSGKDHRLISLWWKQSEKMKAEGKAARAAVSVSVPHIRMNVQPAILQDALQDALEGIQHKLAKSIVESWPDNKVIGEIAAVDLSPAAIASYHAVNATGSSSSKLTKTLLEAWFDNSMSDAITLAIATSMQLPETPSSEQLERLEAATNGYKNGIVSLHETKVCISAERAEKLQNSIKKYCSSSENDPVKLALLRRLGDMMVPSAELYDTI